MDKLLSSREIAEYLNLQPVTVRRKAARGEIPAVKIGNRFRFDKSQIDRWLLQNKAGRRPHILVIDDDPVIGQLFTSSLEDSYSEVTTTVSSLEALDLISNRHFDLIFLDLMMPELDGSEVLRHVKKTNNDIPVVIITGYPDSDLMNKAMEYGHFAVIKKPFDSRQIHEVIQSYIKNITIGGIE